MNYLKYDGYVYVLYVDDLQKSWENKINYCDFGGELSSSVYEIRSDKKVYLEEVVFIIPKKKVAEIPLEDTCILGDVFGDYDEECDELLEFQYLYCRISKAVKSDGRLSGYQIYPDEVRYKNRMYEFGARRDEMSSFSFLKGELSFEDSSIKNFNEKYIDKFKWIPGMDVEDAKEGELFFVNPRGTYLQNDTMLNDIISYQLYNIQQKDLIDDILAYDNPILSVHLIQKTSGVFREIHLELVPLVIERYYSKNGTLRTDALELLKVIYPFVDQQHYKEQIQAIFENEKIEFSEVNEKV